MLERETSTQPSNKELESYREEDEGIMINEEGEGVMSNEEDEGEERERVMETTMMVTRIIVRGRL